MTKIITFEDDDEASTSHAKAVNLPDSIPKMVVNDQVGDFIGKFLEQYFRVYDSESREQLGMAYHEEATMSMSTAYGPDANRNENKLDEYVYRSRNLARVADPVKRQRLLRQGRLAIVAFLSELPKTRHDLTTFTLDVPFATERLITFTVSGIFMETVPAGQKPPIRHFNRMFVVVPQGEGLCIINETMFVTSATRKQIDRSTAILTLSERTGMNCEFAKM